MGYHDIRVGNEPDDRLRKFIGVNLPKVLPAACERFEEYEDLVTEFAYGDMEYDEFAARVRRRNAGTNEDFDEEDRETFPNPY